MKNWKYRPLLFLLLISIVHVRAQTLVLDPAGSRFLINEKSSAPHLDLILHSFTEHEKREIARYAVMDTVTKATVNKVTTKVCHITVGRMAERLTLVIRNLKSLAHGYVLKVDDKVVNAREEIPDIAYYQLNGENAVPRPCSHSEVILLPYRCLI